MDTFWAVIVLCVFMSAYMLYTYLFTRHQRRKLRKNPPVLNENFKPFVSILIPCHNEEKVIEDTVKNISAVDWEDYEMILIDDRSDDCTAEILKKLQKKIRKSNI
jgi:cellulose synthase/poly-beta-1,6-N-acetylglucosamine synthase-like glycosyltransferase